MSDDSALVISGGGTTVVATEALLARRDALASASTVCVDQASRVAWVRTGTEASLSFELHRDERALLELAENFAHLAHGVQTLAEVYGHSEHTLGRGLEHLATHVAAVAGFLGSRLGLIVVPGLLAAAGVAVALWRLLPADHRAALEETAAQNVAESAGPLSEPHLVEAMRWAVTLADDAALGAAGVPPALVAQLGETGIDTSNVSGAATAVLGLAALAGVHGTAPVRVEPIATDLRRSGGSTTDGAAAASRVHAPTTLSERIARIPDASAPVSVERYDTPEGARFEVYVAGTDSTAPLGGDQPWDMASNVALIAGEDASSLQAARGALDAAGATADSRVVFTGYSQGGAIATILAESGEWNTAGLVTVGAPSGDLPVRGDYPAVVVEHREDLIPGLSGVRRDTHAVVVQAEGLGGPSTAQPGTTPPQPEQASATAAHDSALPAHDLDRYLATAARVDAGMAHELRRHLDALPGADGRAVEGRLLRFTATRIPSK